MLLTPRSDFMPRGQWVPLTVLRGKYIRTDNVTSEAVTFPSLEHADGPDVEAIASSALEITIQALLPTYHSLHICLHQTKL